ncbi:MAG TPA: hypothetical protein VFY84_07875 [Jiangellales bacterium]|nr:hypothetical protein [Jiangellales bacterium]
MARPQGSQSVQIAVRLTRQPHNFSEWLADGAAFEAAGAHALWVDLAPAPTLDPLAVTAALAAVTFRSMLVTTLPAGQAPSEAEARALATIARLSHGRLGIVADPGRSGQLAGIAGLRVFRRLPGHLETFEHIGESGEPEGWIAAPPPDSRGAWRATLLDAAERGVRGLLVPADPRLLDILRNPGDPGDRRDLQLAVG